MTAFLLCSQIRLAVATTAISIFFNFALTAQNNLPGELIKFDPTLAVLNIANSVTPANDVSSLTIRFKSTTMATNPPNAFEISLDGSWFNAPTGAWSYYWDFADDSSYADLVIFDINGDTYSGYGKFLEFHSDTGIGNLTLEDVLKKPGNVAFGYPGQPSPLKVYPNPIASGGKLNLTGVSENEPVRIIDHTGRTLFQSQVHNNSLQLPALKPGPYFLLREDADSRPLIIR